MDSIELENVRPTLLLPPTEKGGIASELAGGTFDLGDRVACLINTGGPLLPRHEQLLCCHFVSTCVCDFAYISSLTPSVSFVNHSSLLACC